MLEACYYDLWWHIDNKFDHAWLLLMMSSLQILLDSLSLSQLSIRAARVIEAQTTREETCMNGSELDE